MVSLPSHPCCHVEVAPEPLDGTVEIDETYVAGKKRRWRAKGNVSVVIGIRNAMAIFA